MPDYIITFKPDASDNEMQEFKDHAIDQGGYIVQEYSLIKGFAVSFSEKIVTSLETHPLVDRVEEDIQVQTQ
ncbi:hypothetical protein PENARI_c002G01243 [Penicillium arizonense]|uniref:Inhibitor I9 domain-containing protein n=1 Tax=Penicillium arizonense TaxID=1835702 RepID=A0A1F5LUE0_PENAI|nr:hypothetical protein PENARI_c002G01243 [Penicillium arizonense]OGE56773.1 hypothetical protein PENARI_c002G01243 [Penicillium arizonense]